MAAKSVNQENDGHEESRFTEEQIIGFIKQAEAGMPIKELCRKGGFSDATFYKWRAKYGGMDVPDAGGCVSLKPRTPSSRSCWPRRTWTSMRSTPPSG
jgi:transposase-like protein